MAPVNKTALECVMEVDHERIKLEAEAERLASQTDDDGKSILFGRKREREKKTPRVRDPENRKTSTIIITGTHRSMNSKLNFIVII